MKLNPNVYLRAARRIFYGERRRIAGKSYLVSSQRFSCLAIDRVAPPLDVRYRARFESLFRPVRWHGNSYGYFGRPTPESQVQRVLALCFMAAIAATETFED